MGASSLMTAPKLNAAIQGQGTVSADNLNTYAQTAQTTSQLRDFTGLPGMVVFLQGVAFANDGNGGFFYWNPSGTEPDDNFNYIVPEGTSSGEWVRTTFLTGTIGESLISISVIASLEAATTATLSASQVYVLGYNTEGDGGGGVFYLGTATTANGGTIINDASGRSWYRVYYGIASVDYFGADSTGTMDSTSAFTNAFNVLDAISVPPGNFIFKSQLSLSTSKPFVIFGSGSSVSHMIYEGSGTANDCFVFGNSTSGMPQLEIYGIRFLSNTKMISGAGLHIYGSLRATLRDVQCSSEDFI